MDLVRTHILKQISLRQAAEGHDTIFLAQDRANDRVFVVNAETAAALRRFLRGVLHPSQKVRDTARAGADETTARQAMTALQMIHTTRLHDLTHRKPFNPIFAAVPLFDAGRMQPYLHTVARYAGGWFLIGVLCVLCASVAYLGTRNNWQILDAFRNVFSLQAILTFGLVAPFLKIIHELGHILVATRHGVRVRKAGLYVIGLYPMPFVDCSRADISATRSQRIAISGAGVVTDIIVGLTAFILWHLVEGDYLRALFANIFVFSTLNSILFNGNPLIRLDGYYVFVDVIGQRNLGTRSSNTLKAFRQWVASFGAQGHVPRKGAWGLLLYGLGALAYRIYILAVIAWALLPTYLGLGATVVAWAAYVMFFSPLLRAQPTTGVSADRMAGRRKVFWVLGLGGAGLAALLFIKWPVIVSAPMTLEADGRYALTAQTQGQILQRADAGRVAAGTILAQLDNPLIDADIEDLQMSIALAQQFRDSVASLNPAQSISAQEQLDSLNARLQVLRREQSAQIVRAERDGVFIPHVSRHHGEWVPPGARLGTWYPDAGAAIFSGPYPEIDLSAATDELPVITLRLGRSDYIELSADVLELREIISRDRESGVRSLRVFVSVADQTPADLAGTPAHLRLRYPPVPLWRHIEFAWARISASFYEAQVSDRARLLNR